MSKKKVFDHQPYQLKSDFSPTGDQPDAISLLTKNISSNKKFGLLHGVTGTGKTFTLAHVISNLGRPALVLAPNKTLAAQLYHEFKEFFPSNKVRYFVSYYDYYQPEAYIPATDTFIEKDSAINEEIDKMRHSATKALLESRDTIIIASISCIYGLGAPEDYFNLMVFMEVGEVLPREELIKKLVGLQYTRTDVEFKRGTFRVRGETVDIFPSDQDASAIRIMFFGDEIEEMLEFDPILGKKQRNLRYVAIYPLSHFLTGKDSVTVAINTISEELEVRLKELTDNAMHLEAQRLEQRVRYDIELLKEIGFCPGIENYSRHLAGRAPGSAPTTLIDYFPKDFLLFIDESHVTVPQIGGMSKGDRARKTNLVEHGFRLPSAIDNRPLKGEEFWDRVGQTIFVSATPGNRELEWTDSSCIAKMINRPTGLLDPKVEIKPATNQVEDLISEANATIAKGCRVLVTTLTKKMAENIAEYFREMGIKAKYLHSEINTVDRVEILRGLRRGDFDVLIGINLLREGLDLVEVALVAILDADKEGFLRSHRSLIQTMGRAARNLDGRVIMYADKITDSMRVAINETENRRKIQTEYNKKHNITPRTAKRAIDDSLVDSEEKNKSTVVSELLSPYKSILNDPKKIMDQVSKLRKEMYDLAAKRDFENAAKVRDTVQALSDFLVQ